MVAWARVGAVAMRSHGRSEIHFGVETAELADVLDVRSESALSSWVETAGCRLGDGKGEEEMVGGELTSSLCEVPVGHQGRQLSLEFISSVLPYLHPQQILAMETVSCFSNMPCFFLPSCLRRLLFPAWERFCPPTLPSHLAIPQHLLASARLEVPPGHPAHTCVLALIAPW